LEEKSRSEFSSNYERKETQMNTFGSDDIEAMAARKDVDGLHQLLEHGERDTRLEAALALAEMDDSAGWHFLIEAAGQSADRELREDALTLLGDMDHERVIPVLEEALKQASDETAGVYREALETIGGREADDALRRAGYEPVVPHMSGNLQLMEYEGKYVRSILPDTAQIKFLSAEEHLNQALDLREAEMTELGLIEDSLALWLAPEAADAWYLRGVLFEDLERIFEAGLCYRWALELDPNQTEAGEALADLEAEGPLPALDLDGLLNELNSLYWNERRDAAAGLGEMGEAAPAEAVERLIARLGDEERDVRHAVIEALGNIGDKRAVQALLATHESSWLIRFAVIEALAQLRTVDGLTSMLRSEMEQVQERNPVFSSQKDPLLAVEYERLIEIGVLAYEKTGDIGALLTLAEGNVWEEVEEGAEEPEGDDLEAYVDEVAQMYCLALERLALRSLPTLDRPTLERLAVVPDLTLLDVTNVEAQPVIIQDLSGLREAAKKELEKG
jgi:HEAT repeat protein